MGYHGPLTRIIPSRSRRFSSAREPILWAPKAASWTAPQIRDRPDLPRLAAPAPAHTSTCLTALEAWVRTSPHSWTLQHQEKDILAIVKAGVASGDAANAETATTIASLCITAGIDLRKALTSDQ